MSKDLVFIVSGGRTGTRYFGELLCEMLEGAFSVHEPDLADPRDPARLWRAIRTFGFHHMITGRLLGRTGIRNLTNRKLRGRITQPALLATIRRQRAAYYAAVPEPLIVESYYQWYGLLPELRILYPEARIIGIVRDPRDWVTSWLNHGGHHDHGDLASRLGGGRIGPADLGQTELAARWRQAEAFEKHCWDWNLINGIIDSTARADPLVRVWRYEDLFLDASPRHMQALLAFAASHPGRTYRQQLSLRQRGDRRNASRGAAPRWRDWTPAQARCLDRHCGALMRRHGYGDEPEWQAKIASGRLTDHGK